MQYIMAWLITHASFIIMVAMWLVDTNNRQHIFHPSAWMALFFLVTILSLNPLLSFFKKVVWLHRVNRYRQQIGVAVFSHAVLHVLCFASFKGSVSAFIASVMQYPAFLVVAVLGTPIFTVLALTSSKRIIKRMGFRRWKLLHKSVYIAELAVVLHLALLAKWSIIGWVFVPLITLQLLRLARSYTTA